MSELQVSCAFKPFSDALFSLSYLVERFVILLSWDYT